MTQMVNSIAEDMEWIETVSPTVSPQKGRLFLDVRSPKIMDALASPTKLAAEAKNSTSPFKTEETQIKTPLKEDSDESSDSEIEDKPVKPRKESPKKEETPNLPKRRVCLLIIVKCLNFCKLPKRRVHLLIILKCLNLCKLPKRRVCLLIIVKCLNLCKLQVTSRLLLRNVFILGWTTTWEKEASRIRYRTSTVQKEIKGKRFTR